MKMKSKSLIALACATAMAVLAPQFASAKELVVAIGSRGYGQVVPHSIKDFEKSSPGVSVQWLKVSDVPNETRQLYVTDMTSQNPTPDVYALDIIWIGEFAKRGWLAPLNDYMSQKDLSEYNQSFLKAATLNDKVYGAPLYVDGTHLFYRTDLLKKYGLQPPKTWEELIKDSQTIMKGENNPQLYGFVSMWAKIEGLFMNWLSFTNANGGGFYDAKGNVDVNSPANIKATQAMVDMIYKDEIAPKSILNDRPDDARTLFQQGRAVFMMVQDFVYDPMNADGSPVKGKFDFEKNPYFEGHPDAHTTAMGGFLLGINPFSKNKKEAAALVKSFSSHDSELWAALNANRAPARPDVYKAPQMASAGILPKLGKDFDYGVVRPSATTGNLYPQVSEIMQLQITRALHREASVKEALDEAQKQLKALLSQ